MGSAPAERRSFSDEARGLERKVYGLLAYAPELQEIARHVLELPCLNSPLEPFRLAFLANPNPVDRELLDWLERNGGQPPKDSTWGLTLARLKNDRPTDDCGIEIDVQLRGLVEPLLRIRPKAEAEGDLLAARRLAEDTTRDPLERREELRRRLLEGLPKLGPAIQLPKPFDWERFDREGAPPVRWLLPGRVAAGHVILFCGGPGEGKTTYAYGAAHEVVALGLKAMIIDQEMGPAASPVLLDRLGPRSPNLELYTGCPEFSFGTQTGFAYVDGVVGRFRPAFVVYDSWSHAMRGIESENNSTEVAAVFEGIHLIRDRYDCTILMIDQRAKWGRLGRPDPDALLDLISRGSIEKVYGSDAVWGLLPVAKGRCADLVTCKHRGLDFLPPIVRVSFTVGPAVGDRPGPIILTSALAPEPIETLIEKATAWIERELSDGRTERTGQLVAAAQEQGFPKHVVERALRAMREKDRLDRSAGRGNNRLTAFTIDPDPEGVSEGSDVGSV